MCLRERPSVLHAGGVSVALLLTNAQQRVRNSAPRPEATRLCPSSPLSTGSSAAASVHHYDDDIAPPPLCLEGPIGRPRGEQWRAASWRSQRTAIARPLLGSHVQVAS